MIEVKIKKEDLDNAITDDGWSYLFHFTDKYFEAMNKSSEALKDFNDEQLVLIAYNYLYGQVVNGGFIQMISNRMAYAFEEPFSETMREWGAKKIADIVDKAKMVYENNKEQLLQEQKNWEDFSKLYDDIKEFEPLDGAFYDCMDEQTLIIKRYVENNLDRFATII